MLSTKTSMRSGNGLASSRFGMNSNIIHTIDFLWCSLNLHNPHLFMAAIGYCCLNIPLLMGCELTTADYVVCDLCSLHNYSKLDYPVKYYFRSTML